MNNPRTRRVIATTLAAAVIPAIVAVPASAAPVGGSPPTACEIERLPEPEGSPMSIVTGADPTGRFVTGRGYPEDPWSDFHRIIVIWDRGQPAKVAIPGIDQQLGDINAAGVAVGSSYDEQTWEAMTPWVYRDGRLSPLPGVASGTAEAINARGDIVGERVADNRRQPVWWPAGGRPVDLPLPEGTTQARATDIDDDGTIVGIVTDADFVDHPYLWRAGEGKVLALPAGSQAGFAGRVRGGWASGHGAGEEGYASLRWNLRTGEVRRYPQFDLRPDGLNARGWLAGGTLAGWALMTHDRGDIVLPGLTNAPLGDIASELSDDGRTVAGQALDADQNLRAVRWLCR